jgi:hypothetical protein
MKRNTRIIRVGPILESADAGRYYTKFAGERRRMEFYKDIWGGKSEDIPWKVAAKVFAMMKEVASTNGIEVENNISHPMQGNFTFDKLTGVFRVARKPGYPWMWYLEYKIWLVEDDWWLINMEYTMCVDGQLGKTFNPIVDQRYFRCDDLTGLQGAVSDTITLVTTESAGVFKYMERLKDVFS